MLSVADELINGTLEGVSLESIHELNIRTISEQTIQTST
jgi:hypothetical protein